MNVARGIGMNQGDGHGGGVRVGRPGGFLRKDWCKESENEGDHSRERC